MVAIGALGVEEVTAQRPIRESFEEMAQNAAVVMSNRIKRGLRELALRGCSRFDWRGFCRASVLYLFRLDSTGFQ